MIRTTIIGAAMAVLAPHACAQDRTIERGVTADALSLVFDDPVTDEEAFESSQPGLFEETASASAVVPPFASNRSSASQRSFFQPGFRPGEDVIDASGSAVAQLFIQGLGDAAARSTYVLEFAVGAGSRFEMDEFNLLVDDRFGGDVSRDRPGDASASLALTNLDTGEILFEESAVLDDAGTEVRIESNDTIVIDLDAGRYELRIEAIATDETAGFDEVQDSLAAASFFVCANVFDPAPCPTDLDGDGLLTIFDFLAFQNLFDAGDPRADLDGDGELTIFDFLAYQNAFDAGCP
ncbi:MAG: GC-type dockerin domain-anchored protein [Planctomycetota bacterium]